MAGGELKGVELFVFTDNLVSESLFYKVTLKKPLMFELVLRLHQVYMRGELILHVIHITCTQMIEAGIDGLSRGNNLGDVTRVINHLHFVPLYQGAVMILAKLDPWIRTWWGES